MLASKQRCSPQVRLSIMGAASPRHPLPPLRILILLTTYRRLLGLLDARERRRFALLLGLIVAMGLVNMAGVASIMPFLAVLANPEIVREQSVLAAAYRWLGFDDVQPFLILLGAATFAVIGGAGRGCG